ncbi:MogA/MoaB family molybdenum cofactor biosynthesis protein [Parasporobacterium paucivorans]|uniref:Molybdenum cofactor synthesis domain-containing protein n=1 Tax=Parasporobacterium paucivorans DSM 15970 TaxID=1122934 RepID=A0A1M6E700_9FIRM|nr:MogA/MoaB family molybdenum cofactor biosynthesis protein [Parasporobacterium paucivorans]SHI81159.1 molybdenum cofactor synthesis domain-containing protein [Parasporobacterium paucivorans DSM 15970]
MYSAAVITVSDKGSAGLREDTAGPAVEEILKAAGYEIVYTSIIPDEAEIIKDELIKTADEMQIALVVTTGGTGFSKRDVTPEATIAVCEKLTPGIPEAMRAESMKVTNRAILSRMAAGIRGETLIVNLPGSPKAAKENLLTVVPSLEHGLDILRGNKHDCAVNS